MICLLIAVIPEALFLTIYKSISEFALLEIFQDKRLAFKDTQTFEKLAKIDCVVFEKEGSLTNVETMEIRTCFVFDTDVINEQSMYSEKFTHKLDESLRGSSVFEQQSIARIVVDCMFYGCTAWIQDSADNFSVDTKSNYSNLSWSPDKVVKGTTLEITLVKFLYQNFREEYEQAKAESIEILHWKQFTSQRKRTTIVFSQAADRDNVIIISKGMRRTIMHNCTHILTNTGVSTPLDVFEEDKINNHYLQLVANNMKGLLFSYRVISRTNYDWIRE